MVYFNDIVMINLKGLTETTVLPIFFLIEIITALKETQFQFLFDLLQCLVIKQAINEAIMHGVLMGGVSMGTINSVSMEVCNKTF